MAESFTSSSTWAGPVRPPAALPLPVAVRTLGCKVNRVDSERIVERLLGQDCVLVAEDDAAVIVVNTCAVTGEAEAKARKAARHAADLPHEPLVIVTGCAAAVSASTLSGLHERVLVEADKDQVAARVSELRASLELDSRKPCPGHPLHAEEPYRTRRMLKVEDGCDAFCAYCIVPYARGNPRSVPLAEVRRRAAAYVAAGVPEIVITGINVGRYADGDATLPDVIAAVCESGVERVRLSSVEPPDIGERLLAVLGEHAAVAPHLHVPLQAGADRVLAAMGRGYTVAEFEARIAAARAAIPGLAITTDVIVGFPGESEEDARATIEACERIGFAKLHVFRYSARSGTRAAELSEQIGAVTVKQRADALRACGERLVMSYRHERIGGRADLLVERVANGVAEGTTGDYLKVKVESEALRVGQIVEVEIVDAGTEWVAARLP